MFADNFSSKFDAYHRIQLSSSRMKTKASDSPFLVIFLLYLIPILAWVFFTYQSLGLQGSFFVAISGAVILFFGVSLLGTLFRSHLETVASAQGVVFEKVIQAPISTSKTVAQEPSEVSIQLLEENKALREALEKKSEELEKGRFEQEEREKENTLLKEKLTDALENSYTQDESAKKKVVLLQENLEERHQMVLQLEKQIQDLRYEIKTLLQLTEVDYSRFSKKLESQDLSEDFLEEELLADEVKTDEGAKRLANRLITIAERMNPLFRSPARKALSNDPYALDLRRLKESLSLEKGGLILAFSPSDEKLVYVGPEIQDLLMISEEKFAQEFSAFIEEGEMIFAQIQDQLLTKPLVMRDLPCKKEDGGKLLLRGVFKTVQKGAFRSLIIGVLYRT